MNVSSISSASIAMHQEQLKQAVDVSMVKKSMDSQQAQVDTLLRNLDTAVQGLGNSIDIMA